MSNSIIEIEGPGTKSNPIDTKNNIFIVQSLKPNTYFSYKCVKCGKIQSPVFFDKRHIELYETFTCRSCRQTIDKNLIGRSKDNPYSINSINDFDKIDLKYGTYIKFNCKQCGKEVIREWRPNRDSACRSGLCERCNIESTSLNRYGTRLPQMSDEIKAKSELNQRQRYGGLWYMQTETARKNQSKYMIQQFIKHPEWIQKSLEANKKNHFGIYYTQTDEFRQNMGKMIADHPEWKPKKYEYDSNCEYIKFDSKWEFEFFIYCVDHNLNITRNLSNSIEFVFNNVRHRYFPDFIIDGVYYEVKGDQFFKPDGTMYLPYKKSNWSDEDYAYYCDLYEAKRQCMISNNVKIIRRREMDEIEDYINCTYGKDFCDKFKVSDNEKSEVVINLAIPPICINPNNLCYGYTPFNCDYSKEYQDPIGLGKTPFDI